MKALHVHLLWRFVLDIENNCVQQYARVLGKGGQSHAFISGYINVFNQFNILKRKQTLYSMILPIVISNSPVRRDTSSIAKSLP